VQPGGDNDDRRRCRARGDARLAPHRYAEAWPERDEARPEPIDLGVWLETLSEQLEAAGRLVAVFPTPDGGGVMVEAERFRADLAASLDEWYRADATASWEADWTDRRVAHRSGPNRPFLDQRIAGCAPH
jgi:hypothetical protein